MHVSAIDILVHVLELLVLVPGQLSVAWVLERSDGPAVLRRKHVLAEQPVGLRDVLPRVPLFDHAAENIGKRLMSAPLCPWSALRLLLEFAVFGATRTTPTRSDMCCVTPCVSSWAMMSSAG